MKQKVYVASYCQLEDCKESFKRLCTLDSEDHPAKNENEAIRAVFLAADEAAKCLHGKTDLQV